MKKGKVLFLCTHNSARSQMAEAFSKKIAGEEVHIFSAGTIATSIHPMVKTVLDELGIDYSDQHSKTIEQLAEKDFDLVVTLCDNAKEACPVFPGAPAMVHWSIEDPASFEGTSKKQKEKFLETAAEIKRLVIDLFNRGYFSAFLTMGQVRENIVNSLDVGILAHDLQRKIFFFSKCAEKITGIKKENVIGKDCHDIFDPHLCSENCSYCDGTKTVDLNRKKYSSVMLNKHGERKELEISVTQLKNEEDKVIGVVASFTDHTDLKNLERELKEEQKFRGIIGQDYKMQRLYELIRDLAQCDFPVALSGESGTGKELVARAIHDESPRKDHLFVPINCGALPEGTLESELFGHVKGAFTGAIRDKKGRFELADGGTIFLDEVGELSQAIQVKLLRVLQENTFEPVGSEKTKKVDVRIISASNKNLKELVKKEKFRDDLFYRLSVVPVELPALRERRNDIPILANYFLDQVLKKIGRESIELSDESLSIMMSYSWPGNVRQLQNAIQFITIKCHDSIVLPKHLPPEITESVSSYPILQYDKGEPGKVGRKPKLNREVVINTLQKTGGNKAKAARILGVGRATLYNFLKDNPEIAE